MNSAGVKGQDDLMAGIKMALKKNGETKRPLIGIYILQRSASIFSHFYRALIFWSFCIKAKERRENRYNLSL